MTVYFERFSARQRAEHFLVMVVFTVLCVTGLPQKYFEAGWARWIILTLGGVDAIRFWHRAAGITFAVMTAVHLVLAFRQALSGHGSFSLVPTRRDFLDAILTIRYYLGLTNEQARFDRYDYRQKFEYWGMIMGSFIVIGSGIVLLYPIAITNWLPGQVIPAAKVAHSNEGLLAFLTIIIWHIYNAHLSPDVFPLDTSIFTGTISEHRMQHEHPLEYERLTGKPAHPHATHEVKQAS